MCAIVQRYFHTCIQAYMFGISDGQNLKYIVNTIYILKLLD